MQAIFYCDTLGLPLEVVNDDYIAIDGFEGSKHLGIWPLGKAARSCFGTDRWPTDVPCGNTNPTPWAPPVTVGRTIRSGRSPPGVARPSLD